MQSSIERYTWPYSHDLILPLVSSVFSYYGKLPPGWVFAKLKDIADIIMGQSPDGNVVTDNPNGLEFHQGKIHFTERYISNSCQYTTQSNKIAPKNSILLCVRAPVGDVNITNRKIAIGRGLCAISPLVNIPPELIFHWLAAFHNTLEKQSTGTTFKAITIGVVESLIIPIPPLAEQEKIVTMIEKSFELFDTVISMLN